VGRVEELLVVTLTPRCDGAGCTRISIATLGDPPLVRLCAGCEHELATSGSIELRDDVVDGYVVDELLADLRSAV
jgi:hypothetical protein